MTWYPLFFLFLSVYMEICYHRLQKDNCILQTLIKDQNFATFFICQIMRFVFFFNLFYIFSWRSWMVFPQLFFFSRSIFFLHVLRYVCSDAQLYLTLCDPMDCSPPGSSVHGDSPGKNSGVGCHFLLLGLFLTYRSKLCLQSPALAGRFFSSSTTWEALYRKVYEGVFIDMYNQYISL